MPHALLVDDDADTLASLEELIAREGFTVATASSLNAAREQMILQRPDVVLLDLVLPDGDGMDLFQDVESRATTEVVMITGHASIETSIEALRLGAADYLIKPVNIKATQGDPVARSAAHGSQEGNQCTARRTAQPRTIRQVAGVIERDAERIRPDPEGGADGGDRSSLPAKAARARNWWRKLFTT
jgi:DNA-binding NtrC family response regulator